MLRLHIGNKAYSSWSLRGWLAVKQSGLPFEEHVLPLYDDAWVDRRLEPQFAPSGGKVPILWDGEIPVWNGLAIIDYLDAKTGQGSFWPTEPAAMAFARSISTEMQSSFMALRSEHSMNLRHQYRALPPSDKVAGDLDRIMQIWAQARARFGGEGDFLFGAFGAADIMFAPVVTRINTYALPAAPFAKLYMDAVTSHPFMQDWLAAAQEETWIIDRFERGDLLEGSKT
jgi:glutathione S-transferase